MVLLQVDNLSVTFNTYLGKVHAVRNVSFSIARGETVAIVGESGCGKSVTAQAVMGLIPSPPGLIENGTIFFENQELTALSAKSMEKIRGKKIGMVFQDPMTSLNPTMRIGKQIIEGLMKHERLSYSKAKLEAIDILRTVGIAEAEKRIDQFPHEFSGGMRQRVMIAMALACKPQLLIADEPTTALDVTIQAQIIELMKATQKEMKMSIILITHDLGIVAGMCDRVIVMYGGEIVESGSVDQIYYQPQHPYTQGLLHSVPRLDMLREKELIPIHGSPPNLLTLPPGCSFTPRCPFAMKICKQKRPILEDLKEQHTVCCWLKKRNEQFTD